MRWRAIPIAALTLPLCLIAELLPIRSYTTADGLAADLINEIVVDSRGFVWFCTPEGLSRFDGSHIVNFGLCGRASAKVGARALGDPLRNVPRRNRARPRRIPTGARRKLIRHIPARKQAIRELYHRPDARFRRQNLVRHWRRAIRNAEWPQVPSPTAARSPSRMGPDRSLRCPGGCGP